MTAYDPVEALVYSLVKEAIEPHHFWHGVQVIKKRYHLSTKRILRLIDKMIVDYCWSYEYLDQKSGCYIAPPPCVLASVPRWDLGMVIDDTTCSSREDQLFAISED